jgi:hypothetical protein
VVKFQKHPRDQEGTEDHLGNMNWPRKRGDALFDPSDLESYGVWSLDERLEPTHPVLDDTASILDRTDYLSFVDNSESETNHGSYLTDTTPPLDGPIEDGEPMTGIERQLAPNIIPDISGPEPVRDENLRIEDSPICAGSPATPDDCPMPDAASPLPEEMVPSVVYPQPERDVVHSGGLSAHLARIGICRTELIILHSFPSRSKAN